MDLRDVIARRKSIRNYKPDPVPPHLVEQIVGLSRQAPSAGALRAYRVFVTGQQLTPYTAPVNLVVCALPERSAQRYGERGRKLYALQDATIYAAYMQLVAVDLGLDTVWVGAFNEDRVRDALGLDESYRPIAILPLGYRA